MSRLRLKPVPQHSDIIEGFSVPLIMGGRRELPRRLLDLPLWYNAVAANILYESQQS